MTDSVHRVERVSELPEVWDSLAESCFQRRAFLRHLEEHNPCDQHYWLLERDGVVVAGAIVYTLALDVLTFLHIRSPVRMRVVGVPCSVGEAGVLGAAKDWALLLEAFVKHEKGLILTLNVPDPPPQIPKFLYGRTLPGIVLDRRFANWDDYVASLTSAYRRRLTRVMAPFAEVEAKRLPCSAFDDEAHALYLQVFGNSKVKLERLTTAFFRGLPDSFTFTTYRRRGELLGWHICTYDLPRFYFFLAGLEYRHNAELNAYFNLLVGVLREGIASGAETIDFGSTAEVPKTRLGARLVEKQMITFHRSGLLRWVLNATGGMLNYNDRYPEPHVFRSEMAAAAAGDGAGAAA